MAKKQFTYKEGELATLDDLDRVLTSLPTKTNNEEYAYFKKKCKITVEYED